MNSVAGRKIDTGALTGGIIMITLGVLFLLSRFDVADFGHLIRRWWPMIPVMIGIPKLFSRETVWSGMWLITIGIWLQLCRLEVYGLTYSTAWPLLLIALGAGMVLRAVVESMLRPREEPHES
ncbi:MAG TPA: DUF5668 domain-containing protein [Thermoanaerobaculia bacterium]|nr:DUF5668 domain-containing protein [Thermoanaerobaculia bacterium]